MEILELLKEHIDPSYRDFSAPLLPTVDKERILGVRIPDIRKIAKKLKGTNDAESFLSSLPHEYFDEYQLHAALIEITPKTAEEAILMLDSFLPYVDNWSTSDMKPPRALRTNLPLVHEKAMEWIESGHIYTKRYAITTEMKLFLDKDNFRPDGMERISRIGEDGYYVMMAAAWYWAEALYKERDIALPYFLSGSLNRWIHNKALQKAVESHHFAPEEKEYFRSLKIR